MSDLQPGPELDALVAVKVMGKALCVCTDESRRLSREKIAADIGSDNPTMTGFVYISNSQNFATFGSDGNCNYCGKHYVAARHYSTSISAAWEVVEKVGPGCYFDFQYPVSDGRGECVAQFGRNAGQANTAPHAICLAALRAVGAM